jgi:hypothetical protein
MSGLRPRDRGSRTFSTLRPGRCGRARSSPPPDPSGPHIAIVAGPLQGLATRLIIARTQSRRVWRTSHHFDAGGAGNTKRKSLLATLALNLLSAPAVLAASDPLVPSSASLSHAEALRGLEHLLVQREDGRWGHLGMQVLSSVGGALLWAALAPAATNALVPRGDMSSGLGAAILHVAGSGLFASLGPTLLESAWMHEGEVLGEAYQQVLTSSPDRPVPLRNCPGRPAADLSRGNLASCQESSGNQRRSGCLGERKPGSFCSRRLPWIFRREDIALC